MRQKRRRLDKQRRVHKFDVEKRPLRLKIIIILIMNKNRSLIRIRQL